MKTGQRGTHNVNENFSRQPRNLKRVRLSELRQDCDGEYPSLGARTSNVRIYYELPYREIRENQGD